MVQTSCFFGWLHKRWPVFVLHHHLCLSGVGSHVFLIPMIFSSVVHPLFWWSTFGGTHVVFQEKVYGIQREFAFLKLSVCPGTMSLCPCTVGDNLAMYGILSWTFSFQNLQMSCFVFSQWCYLEVRCHSDFLPFVYVLFFLSDFSYYQHCAELTTRCGTGFVLGTWWSPFNLVTHAAYLVSFSWFILPFNFCVLCSLLLEPSGPLPSFSYLFSQFLSQFSFYCLGSFTLLNLCSHSFDIQELLGVLWMFLFNLTLFFVVLVISCLQ